MYDSSYYGSQLNLPLDFQEGTYTVKVSASN